MTARGERLPSPGDDLAVYLRYLATTVPGFAICGDESGPPGEPAFSGAVRPKAESLGALSRTVSDCRACPLGAGRKNAVFGEGDPDAALMFVGEGPGADEDATGRPFVGRAGELLDRMILAMGLNRKDVYIANIVKCRPPGNRPPEEGERAACRHFLLAQISTVCPRAIVLLGQTAAVGLLGVREGISRIRGREVSLPEFPGVRILPTYHPAYLLRNPAAKGEVWEDLQQVMTWLKEGRR